MVGHILDNRSHVTLMFYVLKEAVMKKKEEE
jgi:hypothetical protein